MGKLSLRDAIACIKAQPVAKTVVKKPKAQPVAKTVVNRPSALRPGWSRQNQSIVRCSVTNIDTPMSQIDPDWFWGEPFVLARSSKETNPKMKVTVPVPTSSKSRVARPELCSGCFAVETLSNSFVPRALEGANKPKDPKPKQSKPKASKPKDGPNTSKA